MKFFSSWRKAYLPLLKDVLRIASRRKQTLYLVGGALRDVFVRTQKENPDFDFCLSQGAIQFARTVARTFRAGFVVLDEEHGCARVVIKTGTKSCTLDFSDFRGRTLEEDLLFRDFTFNSMAIKLDTPLFSSDLNRIIIDPYGGRRDVKDKTIRLVHKKSFDEDPVRIMRAFAFRGLLGFCIEDATYRLIAAKKNYLRRVSAERIRDELFKVLSSASVYEIMEDLARYKILDLVFPEVAKLRSFRPRLRKRLDVWAHTMQTVKHTALIEARLIRNDEMRTYLSAEISSGRQRFELLRLAALLHDIGKPRTFKYEDGKVKFHGHERLGAAMAQAVCLRLKLSNEETRFIKRLVFMHLRPGYMVTNPVITARAKFRFWRDAGDDAVCVLLLALADERATQGYLLLEKIRRRYERVIPALMREYFKNKKKVSSGRLVNGNDLMKHFSLRPSPLIGMVLRELEELQAIGAVKTKYESLRAARQIIKNA